MTTIVFGLFLLLDNVRKYLFNSGYCRIMFECNHAPSLLNNTLAIYWLNIIYFLLINCQTLTTLEERQHLLFPLWSLAKENARIKAWEKIHVDTHTHTHTQREKTEVTWRLFYIHWYTIISHSLFSGCTTSSTKATTLKEDDKNYSFHTHNMEKKNTEVHIFLLVIISQLPYHGHSSLVSGIIEQWCTMPVSVYTWWSHV